MAQLGAVHSVGESIVRYLSSAHTAEKQRLGQDVDAANSLPNCRFEQLSSSKLSLDFAPDETLVTLYLFRLSFDKNLRAGVDPLYRSEPKARPLSLELHYLLTAWSTDSQAEQTLLSWSMLALHKQSLFDRSLLVPSAAWRADETVQVLPSELSHENMMRIWDAMGPSYRLSTSYVARTVRVETGVGPIGKPVVAGKFEIKQKKDLVDG